MQDFELKPGQIKKIKALIEVLEETCTAIQHTLQLKEDGRFMLPQFQFKRNELFEQLLSIVNKLDIPLQERNYFIYKMTIRFFPEYDGTNPESDQDNPILKAIA